MAATFPASRSQAAQFPAGALGQLRRLLEDHLEANAAQAAAHDVEARQLAGNTDTDSLIERELALAGAARAREAIIEVEAALDRVELGTYGACEACGDPIPVERLEVIPHARLCAPCQGRDPTGREDGWPKSGAIRGPRARVTGPASVLPTPAGRAGSTGSAEGSSPAPGRAPTTATPEGGPAPLCPRPETYAVDWQLEMG